MGIICLVLEGIKGWYSWVVLVCNFGPVMEVCQSYSWMVGEEGYAEGEADQGLSGWIVCEVQSPGW